MCLDHISPPLPTGFDGQAEPYMNDPFPDYDSEVVMAYANE